MTNSSDEGRGLDGVFAKFGKLNSAEEADISAFFAFSCCRSLLKSSVVDWRSITLVTMNMACGFSSLLATGIVVGVILRVGTFLVF